VEDNKKNMHYQRKTYFEPTLSARVREKAEKIADTAESYVFWSAIAAGVMGAVLINIIRPHKSHKSKHKVKRRQ
jgi:hypothetical protein